MKIYMIRHGETDWNKKRKLQGQVDIPLNEFGKLLAKETAPALADVPFAVCYTSPLKRAAETARLVLGDREVPIVPDKRIQEMSFGALPEPAGSRSAQLPCCARFLRLMPLL